MSILGSFTALDLMQGVFNLELSAEVLIVFDPIAFAILSQFLSPVIIDGYLNDRFALLVDRLRFPLLGLKSVPLFCLDFLVQALSLYGS